MNTPEVLQCHFLIVWDSAGTTFLERFPGSPLPCASGGFSTLLLPTREVKTAGICSLRAPN